MTSGNSCKSGLKLYLFSLKRQTAITLLVTGFLLLLCPGMLFREYLDGNFNYYVGDELALWTVVIFLVALLLGVILLCYNHAHLFSRKTADLYYALPIKRDGLLAIRFGAAFTGAAFAVTTAFLSLGFFSLLPDTRWLNLGDLLQAYLLCLMLLLLCMSTLLLFLVNSGGVFHFLFSVAVVCVGIPLLCVIAQTNYESAAVGVVTESGWLKYISPFSYAVLAIVENLGQINEISLRASTVAISLGGSVLLLALSFVMHHSRKSERSGSSFSNAVVPYLITVIAASLGGYVIGQMFSWGEYDWTFLFALIHGAILVAIAVGAIVSKGFRKLWRWLICGGVAAVVMLGLIMGFWEMGRRASLYIPAEEEIASITIEGTYNTPEVTFTSDFDLILTLHKIQIDRPKMYGLSYISAYEKAAEEYGLDKLEEIAFGDYSSPEILSGNFTFTYTLKNGERITRYLWINEPLEVVLLHQIACTDTYAQSWAFTEYPEGYAQYYYNDKDKNVHDSNTLTPEECTLLMNTFGAELQRSEPEVLVTYDYVILELDNDGFWQRLCVPRSFTETLTLAEELLD